MSYTGVVMSEPLYLTRDGILKLEAELRRLKFEERPKIVAEIEVPAGTLKYKILKIWRD